jgi:hypothetical protein
LLHLLTDGRSWHEASFRGDAAIGRYWGINGPDIRGNSRNIECSVVDSALSCFPTVKLTVSNFCHLEHANRIRWLALLLMIEWELLGVERYQSRAIANASQLLTEMARKIARHLSPIIAMKRIHITVFPTVLTSV